ncbi:DUF4833 domain-containing protein [Plasmodiophora brassicae]|uniref:DUF4833 domain-containing protein n=1 Tax=Plasmodiophora brassicae TaxID=37360 RepID=A0A0G4IMX8_PLABS|nr:hypothetical protein PBRA_005171 [Plasmodiophora brassicae]SPQ94620.1 unnamed protein product [Plasmodiophora brassicae]
MSFVASDAQRAKCPALANENIVFIIERSTNDNVVVYEAMMSSPGVLDASNPIAVYWQDIDDTYMAKQKAKGLGTKSDLNMIEKSMAYGISSKKTADNRYSLTLVAVPKKPVELTVVDGPDGKKVPKALATIADKKSYMHKIFVEAQSSLLGPKVIQVKVTGVAVDTGETVTETIKP